MGSRALMKKSNTSQEVEKEKQTQFYIKQVKKKKKEKNRPGKVTKEVKVLVTQSCPTLCNPLNYSPPGSSVHGTLQVRILEWVTIPFSRRSSQTRNQIWISYTAGRFFTIRDTIAKGKVHFQRYGK